MYTRKVHIDHFLDNQVRTNPKVSNTAKETASRITEIAIDLSRFVWDAM